ncbi:MAG: CDP-diacylglycerol--serine O-phosphatidyltransferase [Chlorobi bacterium]|nr:CDP-diacylglycerol--serine O-phosphatidyltransferase [Chlorobiota bacterium]
MEAMRLRVTRSIIPNLFTIGNLFSGFLAIIYFAHGLTQPHSLLIGAQYILAAALFDMLDGIMARLTHSSSELGVELDSLCDVVSFGVAPSVMLYVAHYHDQGPAGLLLAGFPAIAGAYRLARFNVQLTSFDDKLYFRGLPIPAGALTLVSYVVFYLWGGIVPPEWRHIATNFVTVIVSLAMISTIRYDNVPRPTRRSLSQRPVFSTAFIVSILAVIVSGGTLAFPIMALYIVVGAAAHSIRLYRKRREERLDFDDFDD